MPEVSFVIRLWLAGRDAVGAPSWRYQVRHVQSGEQTYCRSLEDLLAFVEGQAHLEDLESSVAGDEDAEEVDW